jgi:hypothetical protein
VTGETAACSTWPPSWLPGSSGSRTFGRSTSTSPLARGARRRWRSSATISTSSPQLGSRPRQETTGDTHDHLPEPVLGREQTVSRICRLGPAAAVALAGQPGAAAELNRLCAEVELQLERAFLRSDRDAQRAALVKAARRAGRRITFATSAEVP